MKNFCTRIKMQGLRGADKLDDKAIINLIELTLKEKLDKDLNFIRYSFYELRVKFNLSELETDKFLKLIREKLQNDGYNVYFTGTKFVYKNANMTVQPNDW